MRKQSINIKIHTDMIRALAIDSATVTRANVIAQRTNSEEIGIIKAMMIENLKTKLANGVAHFIFVKKDGSLREAWGTTKSELATRKINGRGDSRENYCTTPWWDCENGGWKSLRWESIVKVF